MTPHLLHVFPSFVPGGSQMRTVSLVRALGGEFWHSVLPLDGRSDARDLLPADAPIRVLPPPPPAWTVPMVRNLCHAFERERPDAICTYNWGAIEAAMAANRLGLPHLHHEDGFLPDEAQQFKRRRVWTRRFVLKRSRSVIVPSRQLQRLARELWKLPESVVTWIPNGITITPPPSSEERARARAALGIPERAVVVGGVGHLRVEKNYARLLKAFAEVDGRGRDLRLLLLGDGPERERLQKLAHSPQLNGRVVMPGHLDDLGPAWAAMNAFAISSDTEQMPISLLEAMNAGLPVASTDVGDVRWMLGQPQRELVVPRKGDVRALSSALQRLVDDTGLRTRLGALNRKTVEARFSFDSMVGAYRSQYTSACRTSVHA